MQQSVGLNSRVMKCQNRKMIGWNVKFLEKNMIKCISKLCKVSLNQINIKGKTTEKLGVIGKEKAIASEVITTVIKYD